MDVSFYDASDDSQIGSTQTGISDGGTASVTWSGLTYGVSNSWYAVADDGSATTQSSNYSFTVTPLTIDGEDVIEITIDGTTVTDLSMDGTIIS